jgi:hypothetical protein
MTESLYVQKNEQRHQSGCRMTIEEAAKGELAAPGGKSLLA